ncbi:HAD family hydrolase [Streptomyces sp.]|uniref:D-glycero-alpha-D-manno-heptose-1,7-bisphosphate 7-phosphatase n=1 Tax=Streptomyces sp. TaxID=1931 RepID=UPI002BC5D576|nr:HAD family hydrolase [Streptomyces sp.]HLL32521.1 HAD family hydrolase [Streptomyces sp.]HZF86906.1 HAD family hydrolase [Streptomyces sp.]
MSGSRPAVLFDRDGVLVRALVRDGRPYPPRSLPELRLDEDAPDAVRRLTEAGWGVAVVTNQPDVPRGLMTEETVHRINGAVADGLGLSTRSFFTCFHDDDSGCACRKPGPGLLVEAARGLGADLAHCTVVGDRWRDIGAAHRAGCRAVWIDRGYRERAPRPPYERVTSTAAAVDLILGGQPSAAAGRMPR